MQHNGIELSYKQDLDPAQDYQEVALDWAKIKSHPLGFSYAYIKAGDGAGPDEFAAYNYARQYKTAGAAGMMRGAWHVWRWAKPAADQAAWFKSCAAEGTGELRPMVLLVDDYLTEYTRQWKDDSARGDAWLVALAKELLKYLDNVRQYFGKAPLVKMTPAWWDKMGHVLAAKDDATKKIFDTYFLCMDTSPAGSPTKLFELTHDLYTPTNYPTPAVEGILGTYLPIIRCDDDVVWANFAQGAKPPVVTPVEPPVTPPATGDLAEVLARLKAIQAWLHMP